ncbi:hypothetical protein B0H19DRAFT_1173224 [Mycena capillaripes]|nr:hypothetical protein B0H19DRAFT_1173224 [Mycena capillaripes]
MSPILLRFLLYRCSQDLLAVRLQRMLVITLFLRGGVFLFLTILLYTIVEIIIWNNGRPTLAQVPVIPATALHAVVSLLNIKNLATESTTPFPP